MASTDVKPDPHAPARMAAYEAHCTLKERLAALDRALRVDDAERAAMVYNLPYRKDSQSSEPSWFGGHRFGPEARELAADVVTRTAYHDDQDRRSVVRCPGILAAAPETLELARAVNEAKVAFDVAVHQIGASRPVRRNQIKQFAPQIALMQATRQIVCLDERPDEIRFTWASHTSTSHPVRVADKRSELSRRRDHGPTDGRSREAWRRLVDLALERLHDLSENEVIAERAVMAPHPRATVYHHGQRKPVTAALPILYPDDGDDLPLVGPLPWLDPRIKRATRCDRVIEDQPLVSGLALFRYRPDARRTAAAADTEGEADTSEPASP